MNNNIQKYMYWLLLVFLAVGFFYPPIGLIAIICMVAPVSVAFYKGRFWCGNFCPRGSFYDHVLAKISPKKSIPPIFKSSGLRVFMVLFIITVFSIQIYATWGDLYAMGTVFVRLILITTLVGIILGIFYNQRTWCAFCPMGTLASWECKIVCVNRYCMNRKRKINQCIEKAPDLCYPFFISLRL